MYSPPATPATVPDRTNPDSFEAVVGTAAAPDAR